MYKEGRLKDEGLFELINSQRTNDRYRLEDDLTRVPPNYRLQRNWLDISIETLKGYRFYRLSSAKPSSEQEFVDTTTDRVESGKLYLS